MTDYSWVSGVDGDWSASGDWDPTGVPSDSGADVTIGASGTYTVTINSEEGFSVDFVTLANAGTTLMVAGTLSLGSGFSIAAGTIAGAGFLDVTGGAIGGGTVSVANQSITGAVTLSANLTDSGTVALGASGSDTLALGANTLTLTGTGSTVAGTLSGAGMLSLAGGTQAVNAGAALGMGKLAMSGGDTLTVNTNITYAGTLTQAAGTTLVVADSGGLKLTGSATLSGNIIGEVDVNGGRTVLSTAGSKPGGSSDGSTLVLSGGTLSLPKNLSYVGDLNDSGGNIALGGKTLILTGTVGLTNVTFMTAGTLCTKGSTTIQGITVKAGAQLFNFGKATDSGEIVLGDGTTASVFVNVAGGTLTLTNGMALSGTPGSPSGRNGFGVGADTAAKPGSILKNKGIVMLSRGGSRGGVSIVNPDVAANYTSRIQVAFQNFNTGTVVVQSGTLEFDATFSNANTKAGAISVAAGAVLDLNGGGSSVAGAFKAAAGGLIKFSGGTFSLSAGTIQGATSLTGGTLALGSAAVTISSSFTQQGGSVINGSGVLTVTGAASFSGGGVAAEIGGGRTVLQGKTTVAEDVAIDNGRVLENDGTLTWTGGNFELGRNPAGVSGGDGRLKNDATFIIACDGVIGGYVGTTALINAGTLTKANAGSVLVETQFLNQGTVNLSKGALELEGLVFGKGGSFHISNGAVLVANAALPSEQALVFGRGGGKLIVNDAAEFGATVSGFGAQTAIDVTGFKFSGKPKASFVEAASKKQGVLTITDGSQTLKVTLFGQYVAAGFHLASDGAAGGTVVTYVKPAAPALLAGSH